MILSGVLVSPLLEGTHFGLRVAVENLPSSTHLSEKAGIVSTARIEGPLLYRGTSASTETVPAFSPSTLLRARVPGAQDQCGCLSVSRHFSTVFRGVAKAALDCAHRTRAFLGRAFCEQGGHPAAPDLLLIRVHQSARRWVGSGMRR